MSIRVLLVDDDAVFRMAVRTVLVRAGFEICGEAADAGEAVERAQQDSPDLCLVEVRMAEAIDVIDLIARRLPAAAVVVLTGSREDEDLFASLEAGARGYLLKDIDPERLPAALQGAMSGQATVPRELMTRVLDDYRRRRRRRLRMHNADGVAVELTDREYEVLGELADEPTTGEIAERLGVSPVTVRRHISKLCHKLGVTGRQNLIELADRARRRYGS